MNLPFQQIKQIIFFSRKWQEAPRSHETGTTSIDLNLLSAWGYPLMIDSTGWSILISKERKPSKCSKTSKESQAAIGESLRYTEGLSIKRWLRECWPTNLQLGVSIQHTE
ncbi:hypothetical protein AVEN_107427-1 [Araneus ventricosus]|uniref:Uncharacterized protein n=1 Tax=Araneus ventricosus TaxID=182803 RepID=A0A4Y2M142_ARAVE|nr:hypothetical protein AVEN_107427-1 [Araneus ventricosus]